jgi:hypothetical protein
LFEIGAFGAADHGVLVLPSCPVRVPAGQPRLTISPNKRPDAISRRYQVRAVAEHQRTGLLRFIQSNEEKEPAVSRRALATIGVSVSRQNNCSLQDDDDVVDDDDVTTDNNGLSPPLNEIAGDCRANIRETGRDWRKRRTKARRDESLSVSGRPSLDRQQTPS